MSSENRREIGVVSWEAGIPMGESAVRMVGSSAVFIWVTKRILSRLLFGLFSLYAEMRLWIRASALVLFVSLGVLVEPLPYFSAGAC